MSQIIEQINGLSAAEKRAVLAYLLEHATFEVVDTTDKKSESCGTAFAERWRNVVDKGKGRLREPYRFNRADAYPEGEFA